MRDNRNSFSVNLFCLTIVFVMVAVYGVLRVGFADNSWLDLLSSEGLAVCLLLLPDYVARLSFSREVGISVTHETIDFWVTLVLVSFIPFVGVVFPYICVVGAVFLLVNFVRDWRGSSEKWVVFLMGVLMAFYFIALIWGGKCHNPLYFEKIALGEAHIDLMYHATISNLMQTHGFATTGMDGNVYLPYHWASHFVAGRFSDLLDIAPVKFYNFSLYVIFIPLFFKSLFLLVADIRAFRYGNSARPVSYKDCAVAFIIFALFIPLIMRVPGALYGESTLMAATLSLLILSLWFKYFRAARWAELVFISLLTGVLALFKISFGFVFAGVYAWLFFRRKGYTSPSKCLLFVLSIGMFALIYMYNNETGGSANAGFSPRHTLRSLLALLFPKTLFYYSLFLLPFLYLVTSSEYRVASEENIDNDSTPEAKSSNGNLLLELLALISILGFIPIALINLKHNSVYFTCIQIVFGAAMVLALLPEMWAYFREKTYTKIISGLAVVTILILGGWAYLKMLPIPVQQNLTIRKKLLNTDDLSTTNIQTLIRQPQQNILKDARYQLVKNLQELNNKTASFKQTACLWIAPNNDLYWKMQHYRQYGAPFVATSLSGISLINGRSSAEFSRYSYYQYPMDDTYNSNIETIKKKAAEKGFSVLIEVRENGEFILHENIR